MALNRYICACRTVLSNCQERAAYSFPLVQQVRFAMYPNTYVDPVFDKEVYKQTDGTLPYDIAIPIKAAKNNQTSSLFYDPVVAKFTNLTMKAGQKNLARGLLRQTFEAIKRVQVEKYHKAPDSEKLKIETNPLVIFHKAIENCQPVVGLTAIKRGGKTYQVPVPLNDKRRQFLAMKWLLTEARNKPKPRLQHLPERLSREMLNAYNNEGNVIKRKLDLHKQADANKAYAHYRWW
ncbi:small ribosomal subunit protein uS7m-like [Ptychodera flava]|uniref:small ribosomal subunit protein uS7m-like n=1 Tax=Ptychodera flava TaxID=63121 RepID=UPI00396A361D